MNLRVVIMLLSLLLGFHSSKGQTCIIAYKTNTQIYIGSDSRKSTRYIERDSLVYDDSMCKIHKVNNFYFANSGFLPTTVARAFSNSCRKSDILHQVFIDFRDYILPHLSDTIQMISNGDTSIIWQMFGREPLCILVGWFANDTPNLTVIKINAIKDANGQIAFQSSYGRRQRDVIGSFGSIYDQFKDKAEWVGDIPTKIERLITIESEKDNSVGLPVDLIRVDAKGHTWIKKKQHCIL